MASSLRNLARRNVPKAQPEPEPPSVTEEAPPVVEEVEAVVTPPETESVLESHVVQPVSVAEEASNGEVAEDVVEVEPEPEPEPTIEETPVVVSAPVEEVKATTPSRPKKKKAQKVVTTGEASTDEKKEAETK